MKVLFICKANVGRSQMAEAFFNNFTSEHLAVSAGLSPPPEWEGQFLAKTKYVVTCMQELGIDLADKKLKKITREMVTQADKIIVLGERNNWPQFLKDSVDKVIYWDIFDPVNSDRKTHCLVRDQIKNKVIEFINQL